MDPQISAAIIAGIFAVIVAIITGIFAINSSQKKKDGLKDSRNPVYVIKIENNKSTHITNTEMRGNVNVKDNDDLTIDNDNFNSDKS